MFVVEHSYPRVARVTSSISSSIYIILANLSQFDQVSLHGVLFIERCNFGYIFEYVAIPRLLIKFFGIRDQESLPFIFYQFDQFQLQIVSRTLRGTIIGTKEFVSSPVIIICRVRNYIYNTLQVVFDLWEFGVPRVFIGTQQKGRQKTIAMRLSPVYHYNGHYVRQFPVKYSQKVRNYSVRLYLESFNSRRFLLQEKL